MLANMMSKNELKANHNNICNFISCPKLANMMSKNELKANHNCAFFRSNNIRVGKYDVKERIESKSQLRNCCGYPGLVGKYDVKERIESKSQLPDSQQRPQLVGKYDVKERIESKSQLDNRCNAELGSWQI